MSGVKWSELEISLDFQCVRWVSRKKRATKREGIFCILSRDIFDSLLHHYMRVILLTPLSCRYLSDAKPLFRAFRCTFNGSRCNYVLVHLLCLSLATSPSHSISCLDCSENYFLLSRQWKCPQIERAAALERWNTVIWRQYLSALTLLRFTFFKVFTSLNHFSVFWLLSSEIFPFTLLQWIQKCEQISLMRWISSREIS